MNYIDDHLKRAHRRQWMLVVQTVLVILLLLMTMIVWPEPEPDPDLTGEVDRVEVHSRWYQ